MATRKKASPAQLAARKLFAARAKAGTLRKGTKRKTNPAKKTMRKYSGKFPTKIKSVSSFGNQGEARVTLNNGEVRLVKAHETGGLMPKVGKYLTAYVKNPVRKAIPTKRAAPVRENPAKKTHPYQVQYSDKGTDWKALGRFPKADLATQYARAWHKMNPTKIVRVLND